MSDALHIERPAEFVRPAELSADAALTRILDEIDTLEPMITAEAAEAEAARRISQDVQKRLIAAGLCRMTVPKSKGGLELDLPSLMKISQRLSRISGSVGWIFGGVRLVTPLAMPAVGQDRFDEIYRDGPDVTFCASSRPTGTAEAVPGGWRVNGRWAFVSGCHDSDWVLLHCVLVEDGQPLPGPMPGMPATKFALVPMARVLIEDSWYAVGLKATDSHDVIAENLIVPAGDLIDPFTSQPCASGPLYASPFQAIALSHAPNALGIAEAALEDLLAMARGGNRQQGAPTAQKDSEIFHYEIAKAQAEFHAAQAYADAFTQKLWQRLLAGAIPLSPPLPETMQTVVWVTEACRRVVRTCFELGGGSAVYDRSPLQMRLRDMEAVAQHGLAQRRQYGPIGAALVAGHQRAVA
jgi:indole-3-acetate monooxygenase